MTDSVVTQVLIVHYNKIIQSLQWLGPARSRNFRNIPFLGAQNDIFHNNFACCHCRKGRYTDTKNRYLEIFINVLS